MKSIAPNLIARRWPSIGRQLAGVFCAMATFAVAMTHCDAFGQDANDQPNNQSQTAPPPDDASITQFPTDHGHLVKKPKPLARLTDTERVDAELLIESLASAEFAVRERSAEGLLSLGKKVVPLLRKRMETSADLEVNLRTRSLIKQLRDGDFEAKVEAFLAGQDVDFEGWGVFRIMFGEAHKSRELFVNLVREYPDLVTSFHGAARDRAMSMKTIQAKVTAKMQAPMPLTLTDGVAMLLPVSDERVPLSVEYENRMLSVMRMHPVNLAPSDQELGPAFRGLQNAWVRRSTLGNRVAVLDFAMQSDLHTGYPLAIRTLDETTKPTELAVAMQAIARFGREQDAILLARYLDDHRPLATMMFPDGQIARTELGDAAMASVAKLYSVPLTEIGYPASAEHSKLGFVIEDLVFRKGDGKVEEQRKKAREKVTQLLKTGVIKSETEQES